MGEKRLGLLVLYASQTGNAMDAGERVGREAERRGCSSVEVLSMDVFDPDCLPLELIVIFVVSTTGQGDVPDSMKEFWKFLLRRNLRHQWLHGLHYAVFGLGDSGYQKYNFTAKKLDKRLLDLGATPIIEKGLGDDQHRSGYEGALDPWLSSLWSALNQTFPTIISSDSDSGLSQIGTLDQVKFQIIYHGSDNVQQSSSIMKDYNNKEKVIEEARLMSPARYSHDDSRPHHFLKMVVNQRLTQVDYERDVRHFEFEAHSSSIDYQVGDVLEILPSQDPVAVDAFIQRCNLDPECYITVQPRSVNKHLNDVVGPVKLRTFVALTMDIASASPRRYFFEVMSFFATAEHEKERLQYFASAEGRDDLYQYNQKERRTVLEVLEDFPSVQLPFEWLVQLVPPLKTRAFSISSSPLAHPNQVHITVSIVSWTTPYKRKKYGLCSTWLARLDPHSSTGVHIPAWIRRGLLPPPPPSLPLILVGPGTGCAPFRAFVEERAVQSLKCPAAPVLFFFGCRNEDKDFLYKDFWFSHAQEHSVLATKHGGGFFVVFSRDQPHKIYVQHKIKEESEKVFRLLGEGASIYIAGSSTKMPADVTSAIEEIISKEAGITKESAVLWLRRLEKAGRFYIEAWS
ncbi:NADPH-dependent diflavin oxidoreductase 1 isoform X2 [Dioscorea cayenensis subsp. rotundata]|uniref:NADPH-dependent diflavin oxidoreductase 1 n=1 Tax=Dioscorea cayennensis subsp. rotundata TaxID=55577 RepID=A0AB40CUT7_DIOCR|nr:NADPH-dependent diflavin oxidoreductase 1 isoform X2 [Dioscorea cayenensis subsp. rotundata]